MTTHPPDDCPVHTHHESDGRCTCERAAPPPDVRQIVEELKRLESRATPAPWGWANFGEKSNNAVLGTFFAHDDACTPLSGHVTLEEWNEDKGEYEDVASDGDVIAMKEDHANYTDFDFIASLRNHANILLSLAERAEAAEKERDHWKKYAHDFREDRNDLVSKLNACSERASETEKHLEVVKQRLNDQRENTVAADARVRELEAKLLVAETALDALWEDDVDSLDHCRIARDALAAIRRKA